MKTFEPEESWYGELDRSHLDKIRKWEEKVGKRQLDEICTKYLNGCPNYIKHITLGDPAQEILKLIKRENVNMVVMANRGQKGHFRFGSVSEKVVKNSRVPVVTIPIDAEK